MHEGRARNTRGTLVACSGTKPDRRKSEPAPHGASITNYARGQGLGHTRHVRDAHRNQAKGPFRVTDGCATHGTEHGAHAARPTTRSGTMPRVACPADIGESLLEDPTWSARGTAEDHAQEPSGRRPPTVQPANTAHWARVWNTRGTPLRRAQEPKARNTRGASQQSPQETS